MTTEETPPTLSKGSERILKVILALGSVLFVLLAAEVALRITTPKEIMRYYFVAPDSLLHHRFIPNASGRYQSTEFDTRYQINSIGLRDREYSPDRAPGTFRILMLGDSFTEGDGVESGETFSKLIEERLNGENRPLRYEVINAGVGSYAPLLEYLYLRNGGLALNPDLVVLNLDMSDFHDDIEYTATARFDARGVPLAVSPGGFQAKQAGVLAAIKDFFKDHTRLYNYIRLRINRYVEGARHDGNFSGDLKYDKYAMLRAGADSTGDREWGLTYRYLGMIQQMLRAKGIDFWITVYPYGVQVSPQEWGTGRRFWGFAPDTLYSIRPQGLVEEFGKRAGIPVVNMCAQMRDSARTVFPLYLPDNGHWTPRGHQVIASILHDALRPYLNERESKGIR